MRPIRPKNIQLNKIKIKDNVKHIYNFKYYLIKAIDSTNNVYDLMELPTGHMISIFGDELIENYRSV